MPDMTKERKYSVHVSPGYGNRRAVAGNFETSRRSISLLTSLGNEKFNLSKAIVLLTWTQLHNR